MKSRTLIGRTLVFQVAKMKKSALLSRKTILR